MEILYSEWKCTRKDNLMKTYDEQYHGKMSHAARDKAIAEFGRDDEMKVMIASLKCGGLGRKLTIMCLASLTRG